jgi:SNF2 family DNA or RNA helicase
MPGFLDTLERFQSRFRHPIEKTNDRQRLAALRERIRPFVLRRLKSQVAQELPPKTEILRTVELGTAQRDLYETVRLAVNEQVRKAVAQNGFQRNRILVLDALLKLRQICAHPQLLQLPEAQKVQRSAKLELLLELLSELLASGRRILIFSQFVRMLAIIEKALQQRAITYCKLTGRTRQRDAEIARFQAGEAPVFLISLKAGGVGLNLTAADTVIHYDPWWNPAAEQQATDRSWRIGQSQPVFVYKLIAAGTLEEQIVALQNSKRALSQELLEGGPQKWDQQQLLGLLQGGI